MAFGVYIHIPFCLQKCSYCDFTTFGLDQVLSREAYVDLILKEISVRQESIAHREIHSVYFGGGTPSLLRPHQIVAILNGLANEGFSWGPELEITLEINPGTLSKDDFRFLKDHGVNRFSIGGQTFNDSFLKACRREHSARQTKEDLSVLNELGLNYTFDLLFGLPGQNLHHLRQDLQELTAFNPPHVSPYCLTLPEGHFMNVGRAKDEVQVEMFNVIEYELSQMGLERYEISNFSQPGRESRHNWIYWTDQPYWGLGISAHSYEPSEAWGMRYWNPKKISEWLQQIENNFRPEDQIERLQAFEAMTDFCHTQLRKTQGLQKDVLRQKWPLELAKIIESRLEPLKSRGWVKQTHQGWYFTDEGRLLSDQAYSQLTFLSSDLTDSQMGPY